MSASANSPVPQPEAKPGLPPTKVAAPAPIRPSRRKWLIPLLLVTAAGGAAWALRPKPQQAKPETYATVRTVRVATGPIERRVRLGGNTSARNFANIVAPQMRGPDAGRALILIQLAKSGTIVKKGDLVAQIDSQSIKDHVDDVEATVVQYDADIRKRKAEHAIEMENFMQSLRVSKANYDKTRLDARATELRTSIDQELLKLSAEETDAQYRQLQRDLKSIQGRQQSELRLLEIARERQVRHRDRHKHDVERFTIIAPIPGLVVMQTFTRGGDLAQIQLGDQVSPGQPFMKIVDTNSMKVDAMVNQTQGESIRLAQQAWVEFDAFPGLRLPGKVSAVGALAVGGWRLNYFIRNIPVRVEILGADPRVIPDLSASADVLIGGVEESLLAPRSSVRSENGKTVVFVKQAGLFASREVELGGSNHTHVAVKNGLKAGEEIALLQSALP